MNAEVHVPIGVATATGLALVVPGMMPSTLEGYAVGIGCAVVGACMPDIDANGNSKAKKTFKTFLGQAGLGLLVILFLFWHGDLRGNVLLEELMARPQAMIGLLCFFGLIVIGYTRPHREFTHWLIALILFTVTFYLFMGKVYALWFCAGMLSHQVIDMLNKGAVRWLSPIIQHDFSLYICPADSKMSSFLGWLASALTTVFVVLTFV